MLNWIDLESGTNVLENDGEVLLWGKDKEAYLASVMNAKGKVFVNSYTGEIMENSDFSHYAIIAPPEDPA